ncbi:MULTISPECIES: SsgA family sporulation/cell division regulator [Streptomyces]|uniref:SsgA family sporulation/cell division regulator n=2 Tax=Streptomyces TaxID=1883 RepID=A0A2U9PBY5_STRAS|nr:SsgA family sporulation/cell division regulator [Streptomyces actuosus]AWT47142.1 SsgA family sporulation/cell division regulator [Streptomyces actuosus]MBM4823663.1 SsgA family sporulation/cell division regulator [Streptomyces actuosus]
MNITLELPVGARLLTADSQIPTPVTLRYTSADPLAVHLDFPAHVTLDGEAATWTFARALLADGLVAPAGVGRVRVIPDGPVRTLVEFTSPHGVAVLRFHTELLRRFLTRTHTVVAPGEEEVAVELEHDLATFFGGGA